MMQVLGKWVKRILTTLIAVYVVFCVMAYLFPQCFFYNPTSRVSRLENAHANGFMAERIDYASADGTALYGWYLPPRQNNFPLVVFMHGNSYNIENFYHKMIPLAEAGYGVFMPEYRGFGGIKGKISQKNLENDALAALAELHKMGYKNNQLVIYGMSLGSHLAVNTIYQMQKGGDFASLILEVPFDNIENVVRLVVPVPLPTGLIVREKYHNEKMLSQIKAPILIMGASDDTTVPVELAKNLYTYASDPKKMIIYEGGTHSGLYQLRNYRDVLLWLNNIIRK